METRDRGDKAEPQPIARRAAAPLEPVKATEYVLMLVERNSRTIVGDRNHRAIIAPVQPDHDLARLAAMFDRVVHQVGERVEQEVAVPGNQHRLLPDHLKIDFLFLRSSVVEVAHRFTDLDQVHRAET